jgi:1-acyl-sn-glycerol-3-phosphate acyltransferase
LGAYCGMGKSFLMNTQEESSNASFQGMQFFNFIFLARSWASDRQELAVALASLGREAERDGKPLCFMLYPEGTLVSKDTRPRSKKYADKMGIVRHAHE